MNRFEKLLRGTTPYVKYTLHALALLTADNPEQEAFGTHRIYELYADLVAHDGLEPLSEDRMYRLLKEQSFLGVTESNHIDGASAKGVISSIGSCGAPKSSCKSRRYPTPDRWVRVFTRCGNV